MKPKVWWLLTVPIPPKSRSQVGERRKRKEMVPTVTILLLENLSLILAFGFLVKVGFPIPGALSGFLILARDTPSLPSFSKRGGPTFPRTRAHEARTSSGPGRRDRPGHALIP